MVISVALGAVLVVVFAWYASRLARSLSPRIGTYLLVGGALASTTVVVGTLGMLGATAVAQLPAVAELFDWHLPTLRNTDPVPIWAALLCTALLFPAGALGLVHLVRRARGYRRLRRSCRSIRRASPTPANTLIVLENSRPDAFATPVDGGRIVVTSGLIDLLSDTDQRVLLAHEAAHLRHRHAWLVLVVDLCAAINPWLRGVARGTRHSVERWADECAADAVGDRRAAAHALARAALHVNAARHLATTNPMSLAAVGGEVPRRVRALLAPPPRTRLAALVLLLLLLAASVACLVQVQRRTDAFFDRAGYHYDQTIQHVEPAATVH